MNRNRLTNPVPSWAEEELERVHDYVRESLPETLQPFWDSNGFELAGFDRRPLRPYLVLLVARHYGSTGERPLRLAASIHMIHMASLLHDRLGHVRPPSGIEDGAEQDPHHREALDILLGDFFFSKASRFIVEDGETRIIQEHIQTSVESAEAQAKLVGLEKQRAGVEPGDCFEVVADKVSLLLSLSLRIGAILGEAGEEAEAHLGEGGILLGRAVRILEDLKVWERISQESFSLPPDAKFSHPMLLLWEEEGRAAWEKAAGQLLAPGGTDLGRLRGTLEEQGYLAASRKTAHDFSEQAWDRLGGLADTEERRLLEAVIRLSPGPGRRPEEGGFS